MTTEIPQTKNRTVTDEEGRQRWGHEELCLLPARDSVRPKTQLCSLLLGFPRSVVCCPHVSVKSYQLHHHKNNMGWRGLSEFSENVPSQVALQLGALGVSVPDNSCCTLGDLFLRGLLI